MRVLVTGAAGFLGRHFTTYHLYHGDEVVGVDNLSSPHSSWPGLLGVSNRMPFDAWNWFEGNPKERFDLAYHFAAPVGGREKIEGDPLFNADSLRLDSGFFRWAINATPIAVYPSSSAVYGVTFQGTKGQALQEGMFHPDNPNWFAPDEMYGFTKLAGERLAFAAQAYGLRTLCIRPFSGYGEGQSFEYPVPSIARRAVLREDPIDVWGDGEQKRDFIHVDDIVRATVARLSAGLDGYESMNIGSGFAVSFNRIAAVCAEIVGYQPLIRNLVDKPVGVQTRYADNGRMARYYEPKISLREGLERVITEVASR